MTVHRTIQRAGLHVGSLSLYKGKCLPTSGQTSALVEVPLASLVKAYISEGINYKFKCYILHFLSQELQEEHDR